MLSEKINHFDLDIGWKKANESEYPYKAVVMDHQLKIRLNHFPENQMYSLNAMMKFLVITSGAALIK